MLNDYKNILKQKREALYNAWDSTWATDNKLTVEFKDLLDNCYYEDVLTKDVNGYGVTASILMKLNMQQTPSLKCVYSLLLRDDLYQTLNAMDVNPAYFILALYDYVMFRGNLHDCSGDRKQFCLDIERNQNAYNAVHRTLLERLRVFYD